MDLTKQVISLELAKRLKELGVKQESLFRWVSLRGEWYLALEGDAVRDTGSDWYAAFTSAELGELLPWAVGDRATFEMAKGEKAGWVVRYRKFDDIFYSTVGTTEAEARGRMLAYLIENKLLTPNEEV